MPVDVKTLKLNPKNPRVIKDDRFEMLKESIRDFPQMMELRPLVVNAKGIVLGGNQRLAAIKALGMKTIPTSWVKRAEKLTPEQQEEFIIKDNVSAGGWDASLLAEWDENLLADWGVDFDFSADGDEASDDDEEETGAGYTQKITAPIYEPKNTKPALAELCDDSKTQTLIKAINAAKIDDETKAFLIKAAQRHIVFSYEKIADFYAHSGNVVQELMEQSALVIIDFKKAIELGYVRMTGEIEGVYDDEYPNGYEGAGDELAA